jgi:orotate phosphoribosyltransferase
MEQKEVLLEMLKEYSHKKGKFTLASGKESDFFIDCKKTTLLATGHALCGEILFDEIRSLELWDAYGVAAVPLGACSLASAVSLISIQRGYPLDVFYVRKEKKDHGTGNLIESPVGYTSEIKENGHVILLEDVVTTGGSAIEAIRSMRNEGYIVDNVIALVDRLEGARENFESEDVELYSIYTRKDFE